MISQQLAASQGAPSSTRANSAGVNIESYFVKPPEGTVNEEQLFAALLGERLSTQVSAEAATTFKRLAVEMLDGAKNAGKHMQVEDAAVAALDKLVSQKVITQSERNTAYAQAFRAAQLDGNHDKLWDSIGGDKDNTRAVLDKASALESALRLLRDIDAGKVPTPLVSEKSTGAPTSGTPRSVGTGRSHGAFPEGFLFKPVSVNEKSLAVLYPAPGGSRPAEIRLVDESGSVIERGRFTSLGDTGDRAKFAFSKPGGEYPKNITVEVIQADGASRRFTIGDPSRRYE